MYYGDPYGTRTHVTAVKGRCLNRLTNGPYTLITRHLCQVISQFRQLSTFPGSLPPSIIDVKELNFCVRHGNRWILLAIATGFYPEVIPSKLNNTTTSLSFSSFFLNLRSSPRTISIGQLNTLLHLHLRPINHVVFMGPYQPTLWEILS